MKFTAAWVGDFDVLYHRGGQTGTDRSWKLHVVQARFLSFLHLEIVLKKMAVNDVLQ